MSISDKSDNDHVVNDNNDVQMAKLGVDSDDDLHLSLTQSQDIPVEIRERSMCELCKSLIGAAAGNVCNLL